MSKNIVVILLTLNKLKNSSHFLNFEQLILISHLANFEQVIIISHLANSEQVENLVAI